MERPGLWSLLIELVRGARRMTADEREDWGALQDFVESDAWNEVYGSPDSASEIVSQMMDLNEVMASMHRIVQSGVDWVVNPDGSISRVSFDRQEATFIYNIVKMRLDYLAGMQ